MSLDYDFDRAERIEKRKKFFKKFFGWVLALGAAIALAWAITTYALEKTNMVGDSMEATLSSGDTILINKLLYDSLVMRQLKDPALCDPVDP